MYLFFAVYTHCIFFFRFYEQLKTLSIKVCVARRTEQKSAPPIIERKNGHKDKTKTSSTPISDEQLFCVGALFETDS